MLVIHYPLNIGLKTKRHKNISTKSPIVSQNINLLSCLDLFLTIIVIFAARLIFFRTSPILFLVLIKIFYWDCKSDNIPSAIYTAYLAVLLEFSNDMHSSLMCYPSILNYHLYFWLINYYPFFFYWLRLSFRSLKYYFSEWIFRYWEVTFSPYKVSFSHRYFKVSSYFVLSMIFSEIYDVKVVKFYLICETDFDEFVDYW